MFSSPVPPPAIPLEPARACFAQAAERAGLGGVTQTKQPPANPERFTPEFELLFERFEMLASLSFLDTVETGDVEENLARPVFDNWNRMPVGRSGWHDEVRERLMKEIQSDAMTKALLDAGFARGNQKHLELALTNFDRIAGRMRW